MSATGDNSRVAVHDVLLVYRIFCFILPVMIAGLLIYLWDKPVANHSLVGGVLGGIQVLGASFGAALAGFGCTGPDPEPPEQRQLQVLLNSLGLFVLIGFLYMVAMALLYLRHANG